jgi:hypothetical protein
MKTNKKFDCVKMKRLGSEGILDKIKDMNPEEQLAYWQKHTEALRKRQQTKRRDNLKAGLIAVDSPAVSFPTRTKRFDCVWMKRAGNQKIFEIIKDMTLEEELAYWQNATEKLRRQQQAVRRQNLVSGNSI